ncbi:MAG TPA: CHRD domain-containing protein [Chthoniobacterales bacterium]
MKIRSLLAAFFLTAVMAQAAPVVYPVQLDGPKEAPPNASLGTAVALITIDVDLATMRVDVNFAGLLSPVTVAHIHAATALPFTGTAGVATQVPTFSGFPAGVTFGSYDQTFDMTLASSYNPTFITDNGGTPATAFAALVNAANEGKAYLNIHTDAFPAGEIRGFLIPEPASCVLVLGGALLLCCTRRHRPSGSA